MKNFALVYDWLIHKGGGEKTLEAIAEIVPGPLYTLIARQDRFADTHLAKRELHSSFLQKAPFSKKFYRYYLPLFPRAIETFDLSRHECILSVSHAVAKGVVALPHQLHLCYCYTPMRYIWDLEKCYLDSFNRLKAYVAKKVFRSLRKWDIASLCRVDYFAANSHCVAQRIKNIYHRDAHVIYPPVDTSAIALGIEKEDYFVTVSRLVAYKKIDLIIEAFSSLPQKRLVVIGDGPEMRHLKRRAGKNVTFLGYQSDESVKMHLQKARGFIFAAEEDFGIAPVEAQAAGTPVIAFGKGGALETVCAEETGLFFEEQNVESLLQAIKRFETLSWDPFKIRRHALRFSKERFQREFIQFIENTTRDFDENHRTSRR